MKLPTAQRAKWRQSPDWRKASDSFEKVEKVVNPPQKPVVKSSRQVCTNTHLVAKPEKSPMRKQPAMLATKVPNGQPHNQGRSETSQRSPPPKKLPIPTRKNDLTIPITLPLVHNFLAKVQLSLVYILQVFLFNAIFGAPLLQLNDKFYDEIL